MAGDDAVNGLDMGMVAMVVHRLDSARGCRLYRQPECRHRHPPPPPADTRCSDGRRERFDPLRLAAAKRLNTADARFYVPLDTEWVIVISETFLPANLAARLATGMTPKPAKLTNDTKPK